MASGNSTEGSSICVFASRMQPSSWCRLAAAHDMSCQAPDLMHNSRAREAFSRCTPVQLAIASRVTCHHGAMHFHG